LYEMLLKSSPTHSFSHRYKLPKLEVAKSK
jgi:hypothetical protein